MRSEAPRKSLNLTQLRRNKRKRPDKSSGRKCPRVDDVDVVGAADVEPDVGAALVAIVTGIKPVALLSTVTDSAPATTSTVSEANDSDTVPDLPEITSGTLTLLKRATGPFCLKSPTDKESSK
jgi:hypothetical protein